MQHIDYINYLIRNLDAKFVFVVDYDEMRAAHMKAVACRALALPLLRPAGERVEIPHEGSRFAGILCG